MNSQHYYNQKLVDARTLLGKSQQDVANDLNVDRQTIYRAEAGTSVSYELLANLCRYYRIPMTNIVVADPELAA